MPTPRLDTVATLVTDALGAAPGAVVAAERDGRRAFGAAGSFGRAAELAAIPVRDEAVFDLASVTKPFVALTAARLARAGALALKEPLSELLPELGDTATGAVPLELLLAHRAGLEAHIKLYQPLLEGRRVDPEAAVRSAANARRPECTGTPPEDGFAPIYSDMGYLLVGLALARRAGLALDALVQREVIAPLGLSGRVGSARQLVPEAFHDRVLPTEDLPFRGGVVRGLVHDENAFALSGDALSGHAGLFGEAGAVLELGVALLGALASDSGWLGPTDLAPLVRPRPGGSLLAGFDGRAGDTPSSGSRLGPKTFGHLGFTGTSLWIDPDTRFVGVLLTNRVHPSREHIVIRKARPLAYDAMFDALGPEG